MISSVEGNRPIHTLFLEILKAKAKSDQESNSLLYVPRHLCQPLNPFYSWFCFIEQAPAEVGWQRLPLQLSKTTSFSQK